MSLVRNISGITTANGVNTYSGYVVNKVTDEPIPFATIRLTNVSGQTDAQTVANEYGYFSINTQSLAQSIVITAAEFEATIFDANTSGTAYYLNPLDQTLPPVIVTSHKNNYWWLLLPAAYLLTKKKKAVGKVDTGTVVAIGAGVLFLKGFGLFNSLLEGLGLQESQDTKNLDAATSNPYSPWSPNFWKAGPAGTYLLTIATCEAMMKQLNESFGAYNDDEAKAIGVFKSLKTQSQLSFFADWFNTTDAGGTASGDLLTWLRGNTWPNDRLSDAEVDSINQFILRLPKYIP